MILRAQAVITMDGPPIENGAVALEGNRIQAVGSFADVSRICRQPVVDLGECVILPGLINAHCHLDYTGMRHSIAPRKSFAEWVARINGLKRSLDDDDYLKAIALGFEELKKWGTTTVLNIEAFPELMTRIPAPKIRTWWFYELIDLTRRIVTDDLVAGAFVFFQSHPDWLGGFGLSPHALYTASKALYRLAHECAGITGMPLTTHIAESWEEDRMFRHGDGALFDFLKSIGRNMEDCGHGSALANLVQEGLIDDIWIIAHLNELDDEDIRLLTQTKPHIVHCPRSHRYFRHCPFQFKRLHDAGLNICLGTDSLASNTSLDLFAEMRALQKAEPWLEPEQLLKTVTVNAAAALGKGDCLGHIAPGAYADLISIPFQGSLRSIYDEVVNHNKPIQWMMVDGQVLG